MNYTFLLFLILASDSFENSLIEVNSLVTKGKGFVHVHLQTFRAGISAAYCETNLGADLSFKPRGTRLQVVFNCCHAAVVVILSMVDHSRARLQATVEEKRGNFIRWA